MAEAADYGFMLWDGESKGTLNNIFNLLELGKKVVVYFSPQDRCATIARRDDLRPLLDEELSRLPEKYRTVLVLFELEGLSGEDVAALTGTKLATVWVHLHRARAAFLAQMERQAPDKQERRSP